MRLEIRTPEEYLGAVMKNLHGRRAIVEDTKFTPSAVLVRGSVPLAEMFGYSTNLRSLTQGRASFNMEPLDYRPVPDSLVAHLPPETLSPPRCARPPRRRAPRRACRLGSEPPASPREAGALRFARKDPKRSGSQRAASSLA